MKIRQIEIKNFKKYLSEKITLSDQINVVYGSNEAGKTTLIDVILTSLYTELTNKTSLKIEQLRTWNSEKLPSLKLEIKVENDTLKVEKDYENRVQKVTFLNSKKVLENPKNITKVVEKLTGITEEYIYRNTGIIGSYNTQIEEGNEKKKLTRVLQQVSVGTNTDKNIQLVIAKLQKEVSDLKLGLDRASKNPGIIRQKQDSLTELSEELAVMKKKWSEMQNSLKTNDTDKIKVEKVKEKLDSLNEFISKNGVYEEAKKEFDQLTTQIKDLDSKINGAKTANKRKGELEKRINEYGITIDEVEKNTEELQKKIAEKKALILQLEEKKKLIDNKNLSLRESSAKSSFNLGHIFFSLIPLIMGVLLSIYLNSLVFVVVSITISALIYFFLSRSVSKQNGDIIEEIEKTTTSYEEIEKELKEKEKEILGVLAIFKVDSEEKFFEKKAMYISDQQYLKELDSVLFEYMQSSSISELEQKLQTLMLRKRELEITTLKDYADYAITKDEMFFKKREVQKSEEEYRNLRETQIQMQTRLKDSDVDMDKIVLKEEQVEIVKSDLEASVKRLNILEIVLENLEQALKNTAIGVSEYIKMEIEKYLSDITNNRYTKVKVEDDFTILVYSEQKNDWIDASLLSTGTVGQIYFLARIAYFKSIIGDSHPPIIIDDAFITYDLTRLKQTQKILKELSEEFQIILLTCHPEFKTWGNLIELK